MDKHINDDDKFMVICLHPSVLSLNINITTSGPTMQTVSSELQKQNPPL